MSSDSGVHFIYVYRDRAGNPAFFGQGQHASGPLDHVVNGHRQTFGAWLAEQQGQHRIEVIGPLASKEMADAIQTALVSACSSSTVLSRIFFTAPDAGRSEFQFRRYGMPQELAERTSRRLGRPYFEDVVARHGPLMFVRIDQVASTSDPHGRDLVHPPGDAAIRARAASEWQIGRHLKTWAAAPDESPALLVGVSGGPGAQVVLSSSFIDREMWAGTLAAASGLTSVPLLDRNIDALGMRGHSIAIEFRLRFERARATHVRIFGAGGFEHLIPRAGRLPATDIRSSRSIASDRSELD